MQTIIDAMPTEPGELVSAVITILVAVIAAFKRGKSAGKKERRK